MAKLYVGRLPTRCTPRDLDELFAKYGKILHFDIKHGGYAFVEMENPQDAQDALNQLNGSFYEGQRIVVEWSKRIHRVDDICFKCNKPGHWVRDCPEARGSAFDVRSEMAVVMDLLSMDVPVVHRRLTVVVDLILLVRREIGVDTHVLPLTAIVLLREDPLLVILIVMSHQEENIPRVPREEDIRQVPTDDEVTGMTEDTKHVCNSR
ncbi:hypothetical protein HK098_000135 [Nowakowskiella sp. JEL0407]|nr:hypothetical protein HK098_000135 [Nowakowskiella sp. JEL0407]